MAALKSITHLSIQSERNVEAVDTQVSARSIRVSTQSSTIQRDCEFTLGWNRHHIVWICMERTSSSPGYADAFILTPLMMITRVQVNFHRRLSGTSLVDMISHARRPKSRSSITRFIRSFSSGRSAKLHPEPPLSISEPTIVHKGTTREGEVELILQRWSDAKIDKFPWKEFQDASSQGSRVEVNISNSSFFSILESDVRLMFFS